MNPPREPPYLQLERWLAGDLHPEARARFERAWPKAVLDAAAAEDRALRARLLRALPADRFAARVHEQVAQRQGRQRARGPWLAAVQALSLFALAALLLWRSTNDQPLPRTEAAPSASERRKGLAPRLLVHRRAASGSELLADGVACRPGDLLQLGYVAAGAGHGVIVSLDGSGGVTLHFPADEHGSSALDPAGGEHLLPSSFELDAASGFERFVLVSAAEALPVAEVLAAARELARDPLRAQRAALALPVKYEQHTVVLRKDR